MKKILYVIAVIALTGCSQSLKENHNQSLKEIHNQSLKEIYSIKDKGKAVEAELDRGNARSEKILNSKE